MYFLCFEVFTVLFLQIQMFLYVTLYCWVSGSCHFNSTAYLQNIGTHQTKNHHIPEDVNHQFQCKLVVTKSILPFLVLTYLLTPWSRVLLEKLTSKLCS